MVRSVPACEYVPENWLQPVDPASVRAVAAELERRYSRCGVFLTVGQGGRQGPRCAGRSDPSPCGSASHVESVGRGGTAGPRTRLGRRRRGRRHVAAHTQGAQQCCSRLRAGRTSLDTGFPPRIGRLASTGDSGRRPDFADGEGLTRSDCHPSLLRSRSSTCLPKFNMCDPIVRRILPIG